MTKTKKIGVMAIGGVLICSVAVGIIIYLAQPDRILPVQYSKAMSVIDVNHPPSVMGWVDYAFVGYIEKRLDTKYIDPGDKTDGMPYTGYAVRVIQDIKGQLVKDRDVTVYKRGGVARNGAYISLPEGDFFPEPGKLYIFAACGDEEDGLLYCTTANTVIPLEDSISKSLTVAEKKDAAAQSVVEKVGKSQVVKNYSGYAESEIKYKERDRYRSIYDASGEKVKVGVPYETAPPINEAPAYTGPTTTTYTGPPPSTEPPSPGQIVTDQKGSQYTIPTINPEN